MLQRQFERGQFNIRTEKGNQSHTQSFNAILNLGYVPQTVKKGNEEYMIVVQGVADTGEIMSAQTGLRNYVNLWWLQNVDLFNQMPERGQPT